jgi:hypothetical protein
MLVRAVYVSFCACMSWRTCVHCCVPSFLYVGWKVGSCTCSLARVNTGLSRTSYAQTNQEACGSTAFAIRLILIHHSLYRTTYSIARFTRTHKGITRMHTRAHVCSDSACTHVQSDHVMLCGMSANTASCARLSTPVSHPPPICMHS